VADGRIIDVYLFFDNGELMKQVGLE